MIVVKMMMLSPLFFRVIQTDRKEHRIENKVLLWGYMISFLVSFVEKGLTGLFFSMIAAGITLFLLLPLFLLKGLGGGDIKLFGLLAACFGVEVIAIIILSFCISAIYIVIRMPVRFMKKEPFYQKGETICFSIPILIALVIYIGQKVFLLHFL
ncbi:MAG: prepilin peptidase [Lachnospiraceae bacterium]